jgi:hypothetical protein
MKHLACLAVVLLFACTSQEVTTEDNLEERCAEAASALRSCVGSVPEGFRESCQTDPDEETFALIDELVDSGCAEPVNEKADGIFETLFASQCAPAVGAASVVTDGRNNTYTRLNSSDRRALRSFFGSSVDDVRFFFNANIIDEWDLGFTDIQFAFDIAAQTFGNKIYIEDRYRPGDPDQLALLAHELQHTKQSLREGGFFPGFAVAYCQGFYRSDFEYRSHELEVEARRAAQRFRDR